MALGLAYVDALKSIDQHELAGLALFIGVLFFAVVSSVLLVRTYDRLGAQRTRTDAEAAALAREIDRLYDIILSEPQVVVAWNNAEPEIIGDPAIIAPETSTVDHVLTFAAWLRPEQALHLESHVDRLLGRGESFTISLTTASGRYLTAEGRAIGGSAVLKLADVSGVKRDLADLVHHHQQLQGEAGALRAVIEALPAPAWVRDGSGRIAFVNSAYARAVEAPDATSAVAAGRELLDSATRADLERGRADGVPVMRRAAVIVAGARRIFDVTDLPVAGASAFGLDASEVETLRAEIARTVLAHRRTLDQLTTAVAMFGADHKLAFYNSAYRTLWDMDPGFLDETPTDSAVLDRLRAARRLPEPAGFPVLESPVSRGLPRHRAQESEWHLPDLRTLRVVTTPNPDGGVTYLFDDVTERLNLERRFDALIRVQRETLDNLSEAVAVFGSNDGRVRLFNPVFARRCGAWRPDTLEQRPSIEAVIASLLRAFHAGEATWQTLHTAVTALEDRTPKTLRIERTDGAVIDCRTVPLPDGATLVTFHDITDSVHVERVLTERNEALVAADAIKIDFVQHVSYELRSPLTNIIGFTHFLDDPGDRPASRKEAARISRLHHRIEQCAARHHQQHPRPRLDRRRRNAARPRAGRHPRHHACGRRRRSGPAGQEQHHARHQGAPRHRQFRRRRAPGAADSVQPAGQRGRVLHRPARPWR